MQVIMIAEVAATEVEAPIHEVSAVTGTAVLEPAPPTRRSVVDDLLVTCPRDFETFVVGLGAIARKLTGPFKIILNGVEFFKDPSRLTSESVAEADELSSISETCVQPPMWIHAVYRAFRVSSGIPGFTLSIPSYELLVAYGRLFESAGYQMASRWIVTSQHANCCISWRTELCFWRSQARLCS